MGEFLVQLYALPHQVSVSWDDDSAAGEARLGISVMAAEPWPRCRWVDFGTIFEGGAPKVGGGWSDPLRRGRRCASLRRRR